MTVILGEPSYCLKLLNQFSTNVDITDDQAWALGQRTAGAIYELEQAGFTIKSLSSAIKGSAKNIKSQICFTGDTLIQTKDGYKEIRDIKIDDEVYSENMETGERGLKKVKNVFINETKDLIHVFANNEEIKVTPSHPFWVISRGWVEASNLEANDRLLMYDGSELKVKELITEPLSNTIKVYNFEVEDWHTYFVSAKKVLVHNSCGMNNLRVLQETKIKGYKVSLDLERGGSGLTNIHIKVGAEKYVFNPEAGAFLNGQGNRLPNSLRGNKQIVEALKKAQKVEKAGW